MAILAIISPAAGRHSGARIWDWVRARVEHARKWECVTSERPGHARELATGAVARYERVIAVGGDGTVCEVANGLAHSQTPLGIIPVGTANDLSHNLGIPHDPAAAAALAATGVARPIDLGEIHTSRSTRYFVNVAGFGFDAEVAARVNRMPKVIGGTMPYIAGVLQTLRQYDSPRMRSGIAGPVRNSAWRTAVRDGTGAIVALSAHAPSTRASGPTVK